MVKKTVLFLCVLQFALLGTQCNKKSEECKPVQPAQEEATILDFIQANNMNAIKHESGLYYEIVEPGSGSSPNLNSAIYIKYKGTLLNGTVFDSQLDDRRTGWQLRTLIPGWQIAVPLIKMSGKINIIVPSALAYGCQRNGSIPGNSILYFEIELVDFD